MKRTFLVTTALLSASLLIGVSLPTVVNATTVTQEKNIEKNN